MAASITKTVDQQLVWNKFTSDNQLNSRYTLDFLLEYQKEIDPTITTIIDQEKVEKGSILLTKNTIEIVTHIDGENSYTTQSITTSDDHWEVTTVKVQKIGKNAYQTLKIKIQNTKQQLLCLLNVKGQILKTYLQ